jgi:hypothetical protein
MYYLQLRPVAESLYHHTELSFLSRSLYCEKEYRVLIICVGSLKFKPMASNQLRSCLSSSQSPTYEPSRWHRQTHPELPWERHVQHQPLVSHNDQKSAQHVQQYHPASADPAVRPN